MGLSSSATQYQHFQSIPVVTSGSKEQELVKILKRRHPDYDELNALWIKYQAVFTGGVDVLPYLVQHDREHDSSFKARKKRSFYFNYVKQIVNLFVAYLFRKNVTRVSDLPDVKAFWDNADGSSEGIEHPIDNILKQAATFYLIFGKVAIVVDMPKDDEENPVVSEADRKSQNLNPYIYLIKPQNITDWQYGDDGRLDWIRFEESVPVPSDALGVRTKARRWKYTTWTRDKWMTHVVEEKGNNTQALVEDMTQEKSHDLGRVPVVLVMKDDNFKFGTSSGESLIKDIAVSNLALYNLGSITGEEFYNHSLNILVMQRRVGDDDDSEIVLSDKNVLEYDGQQAPHFMAPSSVPVESLQSFMEKLVREINRMSRLGSTDSSLSGTGNQTSGLAHAFSFSDTNQALSDTAKLFEEVEQRIITLVALWLGLDPADKLTETKVEYPTDFGIELFDDEISTTQNAVETVPSKTFAKVVKKKLAKKFLSQETEEVVDKVNDEIELAVESLTDQPEGLTTGTPSSDNAEGRVGTGEGSKNSESKSGGPGGAQTQSSENS